MRDWSHCPRMTHRSKFAPRNERKALNLIADFAHTVCENRRSKGVREGAAASPGHNPFEGGAATSYSNPCSKGRWRRLWRTVGAREIRARIRARANARVCSRLASLANPFTDVRRQYRRSAPGKVARTPARPLRCGIPSSCRPPCGASVSAAWPSCDHPAVGIVAIVPRRFDRALK